MKKVFLLLFCFLLATAFHCTTDIADSTDETESGNRITGSLYEYSDGKPVADAKVLLFTADDSFAVVNGNYTGVQPVDSVSTDSDGHYQFDSIGDGRYNVVAISVQGGDTLRTFHSGIEHSSGKNTDVGSDTLRISGSISGTVVFDQENRSEVFVYIPGTSFLAITDDNGKYTIYDVPPDTYMIAFWRFGYEKVFDGSIVVRSGETTNLNDKTIEKSADSDPLYPVGVTAEYVQTAGVVKVTWSGVVSDNVEGYLIFRKDSAKSGSDPVRISGDEMITDTSFIDTIPEEFFIGTDTIILQYQVKSKNSKEDLSPFSLPAYVKVYPVNRDDSTSVVVEYSGVVDSDTTFAGDTVKVTGDVRVENGVTLAIAPGTVMFFDGGFSLNVKGCLLAEGTESETIVFTSDNAPPTSGWEGIRFDSIAVENDSSRITYCIIENGLAAEENGGAIHCYRSSKVVIAHTTIRNNITYGNGGAVFCDASSPLIYDNSIMNNRAYSNGGGICCINESAPEIAENRISGNKGNSGGGGIYCGYRAAPLIGNNEIIRNTTADGGDGGGISCKDSSAPVIEDNLIEGNRAKTGDGGGIFCGGLSNPLLRNNRIFRDTADNRGGGIYIERFLRESSKISGNVISVNMADEGGGLFLMEYIGDLTGNTIDANRSLYGGGGMSIVDGDITIVNCLVVYNATVDGAGINNTGASVVIVNSTIANNEAYNGVGAIVHNGIDTMSVFNSILWGNTYGTDERNQSQFRIRYQSSCSDEADVPGENNIHLNPEFNDPLNGDFTLSQTSPCVNKGDDSLVPESVLTDIAGNERIADGTVDMGAYEK